MEQQHVLVCSADVAAFVDALETIGYPIETQSADVIEDQDDGSLSQEETYTIEHATILDEEAIQVPIKRFRTNPKEQKEVIEKLFERQKAVVTEKGFMNIKGNKRFKSDVWSWFGDIKLLISRSEAKKLKIPYYIRQCGDEHMMLSKLFVGCFRCSALFIHDSQRSGTSTLRSHMRVCSRPKQKKKKGSPTIIFFPNKPKERMIKVTSEDDKVFAQEQVLNFVLSAESSFDIIEEPEFQRLLQMCITVGATYGDVNIESMLCPQEKLSDFLLNDLYMSCINAFYTEFQYAYGAAFNVNIWVEEQQKFPYISLICHYSTTSGELKSIILHTDEFNFEDKTADHVKEWFITFLFDLPVVPYKRLIVTDNLSNVVSAFKDEQCVKCAYQNINLALQAVVKKAMFVTQNDYTDFVTLVSGCKDLVGYFGQIAFQYQLTEQLKFCKDDNWSSIIMLFQSINNHYEEILSVLNETGETHLLSVDKATISAVIDLFQIFDEALLELSNGVEPTLNIVMPWLTKLRTYCAISGDEFPVVQQLKNYIVEELNEHLTKNITIYHKVATLLDPRFKRLEFLTEEDKVAAKVKTKCLVKECMEAPILEDFPENQKTDKASSGKDRFSDLYSGCVSHEPGNSEKSAHREVDHYLGEKFHLANQDLDQQNKFNPLKYWVQNSDRYPNLSKVALWVLSCPASCIQNDETFWNDDWLVNCCRIHQRPENVNKTLFVKSFKKL